MKIKIMWRGDKENWNMTNLAYILLVLVLF